MLLPLSVHLMMLLVGFQHMYYFAQIGHFICTRKPMLEQAAHPTHLMIYRISKSLTHFRFDAVVAHLVGFHPSSAAILFIHDLFMDSSLGLCCLCPRSAHLTNDAVQKKLDNYNQFEDHCKLRMDDLQVCNYYDQMPSPMSNQHRTTFFSK